MDNEKGAPPDSVRVKVNFRVPGRMPTVYAHHLIVQPGENEVLLSFFEIIPPPALAADTPAEQLELLQETGVTAECVARVTVARNKYAAFADAMQQMAGLLSSEQKEAEKGPENADTSGNNRQD